MTRRWIRVLTGKPGPGSIGIIDRTWNKHGILVTLISFAKPFPRDYIGKLAHTFELLSEAECAALELTWPAPSNPVPTG